MRDAATVPGFGLVAPKQNWYVRGTCLLLVLLLHVSLLFLLSTDSSVPSDSSVETIQWIEITLVPRPQSRDDFKPNVDLKPEAPPPPNILVHEVQIGDEVVDAQSDPVLPAHVSSLSDSGSGDRSGQQSAITDGGFRAGFSGDGLDSEAGASTTCREVQAKYPIESARRNEQGSVVYSSPLSNLGLLRADFSH
jgi:hypothetical protein